MSVHVLSNLINELGKKDKMLGARCHYVMTLLLDLMLYR